MSVQREFRYNSSARQRALLLLLLSAALLMVLIAVLIVQRAQFGLIGQVLGVLLALSLILTIRAQLAIAFMRCRLLADRIELRAPLNHRVIQWNDVVEVRRARVPKLGTRSRWACVVLTRNARGSHIPTLVFDDQLEESEEAFALVIERTPRAQHRGT